MKSRKTMYIAIAVIVLIILFSKSSLYKPLKPVRNRRRPTVLFPPTVSPNKMKAAPPPMKAAPPPEMVAAPPPEMVAQPQMKASQLMRAAPPPEIVSQPMAAQPQMKEISTPGLSACDQAIKDSEIKIKSIQLDAERQIKLIQDDTDKQIQLTKNQVDSSCKKTSGYMPIRTFRSI